MEFAEIVRESSRATYRHVTTTSSPHTRLLQVHVTACDVHTSACAYVYGDVVCSKIFFRVFYIFRCVLRGVSWPPRYARAQSRVRAKRSTRCSLPRPGVGFKSHTLYTRACHDASQEIIIIVIVYDNRSRIRRGVRASRVGKTHVDRTRQRVSRRTYTRFATAIHTRDGSVTRISYPNGRVRTKSR